MKTLTSAGFDDVSEVSQSRRELRQYIVAVQSGPLVNRRDARFDSADLGDERVHPLWRPDVAREVFPTRVGIGKHPPILHIEPATRAATPMYWAVPMATVADMSMLITQAAGRVQTVPTPAEPVS